MNGTILLWRKTLLPEVAFLLLIIGVAACGSSSSATYGSTGSSTSTGSASLSAPAGVAATTGSGQVTISWNAVSGATSYNLYMAEQSGVTKANYSTKSGGMAHTGVTSPFTHTGLTMGTTYYFIVTAVDASGESVGSSEVYAAPT